MSSDAVLVVGPAWVGDMVMAQSLFRMLKEREPGRAIDVLAPGWSLALVARMPEIRKGIAANVAHGELGLGKRWRLGRELRGSYGQAIVLPRTMKSALLPWAARVPRRTGFRGEHRYGLINDMRPFDPAVLDQPVKRYLALGVEPGEALPAPLPPRLELDPDRQAALVAGLGLSLERPVAGFAPGAEYGPAKCWPPAHYAALARQLIDDGWQVWLVGSEKDRPLSRQIAEHAAAGEHLVDLCGRTALVDAVDILGLCRQVVGNDSGLMYIAAAVGAHVHALYGATTPAFASPLTPKRDIYFLDIECSPCRQRVCPLGHHRCLEDIKPAEVHARVRERAAAVAG